MKATEQTDRHKLHGAQAVLLVGDVRKTVDFYCNVLGFHLDFEWGDPPTHARVSSGDRAHASAARIHFHEEDPALLKHKTCSIYVHVGTDMDELSQELKCRGVEIVEEPTDQPWGRQFVIHDINGYRLLFLASS
jgi:uncharacterized glyoxalase superfamily protein PhnB